MNYGGKKGNNYGEIRRRASKFWSVPEPQMRRRKRPETDRITQIHVLEPFRKCWQISKKFLVVFTISEKLRIPEFIYRSLSSEFSETLFTLHLYATVIHITCHPRVTHEFSIDYSLAIERLLATDYSLERRFRALTPFT